MIITVNEFNKGIKFNLFDFILFNFFLFNSVQCNSSSIVTSPSDILKAAAALSPAYAFPHTKHLLLLLLLFTGLECPCQASRLNPTSLSVISPLGSLACWPLPPCQSHPSADGTDMIVGGIMNICSCYSVLSHWQKLSLVGGIGPIRAGVICVRGWVLGVTGVGQGVWVAISEDQCDTVRSHTTKQSAVATAASRKAHGIELGFFCFVFVSYSTSVGAE